MTQSDVGVTPTSSVYCKYGQAVCDASKRWCRRLTIENPTADRALFRAAVGFLLPKVWANFLSFKLFVLNLPSNQ
jgi:hypothetical protein